MKFIRNILLTILFVIALAIPAYSGTVTYTAGESGNFVVPPGVNELTVNMTGGGKSGDAVYWESGVYEPSWARGGPGAGYIKNWRLPVSPGQVIAYSVGAGGVAIAVVANETLFGNPGSNTTFGNLIAYAGDVTNAGGAATDGTHTAAGGIAGNPSGGNGETFDHGDGGFLYGGGGGGRPAGGVGVIAEGGDSSGLGGSGESPSTVRQAGGAGGSKGAGTAGKYFSGTNCDNATEGAGGGGMVYSMETPLSGAGGDGFITITWTVSVVPQFLMIVF